MTVLMERDGSSMRSEAPFTPADRAIIENSIDEYLAEAGIPARPRGWDWLIRLPNGYASGTILFDRIDAELNACEPAPVRPSEWLPIMRETMRRLYNNG